MEQLVKTEEAEPTKKFLVSIVMVARANGVEDIKKSVDRIRETVFPGSKVVVEEYDAEAGKHSDVDDERYLVVAAVDGSMAYGRKPLEVAKVEDLRLLTVPEKASEVAVVGEKRDPWTYRHDIPGGTVGIDVRFTVSSKYGGTWFYVPYLQSAMEAEQRKMMASAMAGANAPPGMNGGRRIR